MREPLHARGDLAKQRLAIGMGRDAADDCAHAVLAHRRRRGDAGLAMT